jgi:hypothetical protein
LKFKILPAETPERFGDAKRRKKGRTLEENMRRKREKGRRTDGHEVYGLRLDTSAQERLLQKRPRSVE